MKYATSVFIVLSTLFAQGQTTFYEFEEFSNLPYATGSDSLQRLNLVVPATANPPLLVWIGGGAWSYVNKDMEMDLARKLAREGIAVASVGHRLSSASWRDPSLTEGVKHPEHIRDIASAVGWLHREKGRFGYDARQMFIGGYSSGGHLAALLILDTTYLADVGFPTKFIKGAVPISGAYDINHYHQVFLSGDNPALAELHVQAVFGNTEADFYQASPTSFLENLKIPMLLISDNTIAQYTQLFEKKIEETSFKDYEVIYSDSLSHGDLWRNMSYDSISAYRNKMIEFIQSKRSSF